jgi:enamine deaminase RidA (YjgF/YER057c/UK114 family)
MAPHEIVNAPQLPPPSGFSHAIVASGPAVYLAGQLGDGETLAEQFDGAAANLLTALGAAGGVAGDLVSLQVFVTDVEEYRQSRMAIGRAWRERFGRHYPAMGLFGVTALFDPAAKVELMGIAVLSGAAAAEAAAPAERAEPAKPAEPAERADESADAPS